MGESQRRYRFGTFEFDPGPGDLLQRGRKIRVQNQVAQLLAILIERAGKLVSRDELQRLLWPDDTFVDFDRGLNKAICALRTTLRDSALKPAFIETIPRRGYRFIGAVETPGATSGRGGLQATTAAWRRIESLAVLPLANQSEDRVGEYFSDGMTEELITAVSRIQSLRVISRTSVMRFKDTRKSLTAIAKELGVDAVIEGSVARSDQKLRITAQLIFAPEDRHIWSGRFEREISHVLELQAEIAQSIADQIHRIIQPGAGCAARPLNPEAYEACLKANYFRDKMTPADLKTSIDHFSRAIELDPDYAQAFSGLSQTYFFLGVFGVARPDESFPKARSSALKALELDDTLVAAHNALAAVRILYDWDWPGAEVECRKAIELNPGDPVPYVHLADYLSIQGCHEQAIPMFQKALAIDPISRVYLGHFGLILYRARQYDRAIQQCRKALALDSSYANAMWFMALSLEKKGQLADSISALTKAVEMSGGGVHYKALLGRACGLAGEEQAALAILKDLESRLAMEYVSPFDLALIHFGLQNRALGLRLVEEAYAQRVFRLVELTWPMFDDIRSDPHFQTILRRIGLSG